MSLSYGKWLFSDSASVRAGRWAAARLGTGSCWTRVLSGLTRDEGKLRHN